MAMAKSPCISMQTRSKTGDFYQATPGVGADIKNIMKLIVRAQISQPKTDPTPQKAVTINIASAPDGMVKKAAMNPSATQQIVRKQIPLMNALPNPGGLDLGNSLNKQVKLETTEPLMVTPASNSRMSGRRSGQLPVTAKSLAVPRGQSLQIPPNAQVRTFPASELLLGIKKEISISSANTSPSSGSSKGSKPHLKLIPKVSQRPNSPMKWVIEEETSSTTPTPDPVKSSVISEILRVVAERENAKKLCDDFSKPVSGLCQEKSGQEQENPMAMCKGKGFFVAKNCSPPSQMGKSNSPTAARKNSEFNETILPLSKQSLESASPRKRPALKILTPGESDEVIGLKDEDPYIDSSQQAAFVHMAAVTHTDKDKVFVSYIPPKSESRQDLRLKTQMALVKETDQMGTTSWGCSASPAECIKTGDFYQATPGVGADIKNIMKLIVGSQISQPKTDPTPQKAVTINIASAPDGMVKKAAMNPSATQQIVRKQIPLMNALPNPGGLDVGNSLNKQVKLETTEPLMVTPASNSRMSGRRSGQLPVTAKSLAVPRGQSLQIPPNAQVQTFPASELLLDIKKEISISSANTSPSSGSSKGSKPHLKLIPKVSQRPNSPMKWVIEEETSSTTPTPDPVKSSVISEILRVVAERENAKKHGDVFSKPVAGLSQVRVSIPPKSESTQDLILKTQRPLMEETNQMGLFPDLERRKADFNMSVNKVQNLVVCGSAVMNRSSQKKKGIHKMQSSMRPTTIWTSSLAPESCQMADNLLRRIFGITANVNICLQRIDGASAGSLPAEPLKSESMRPVETHVEPACRLDLSSPQETDSCNDLINVKRVKVKIEQELSEDFTTPYPHTDTGPLKCSHFEEKKCHSGNASCDVKTEPVSSYMEPIDEDFISTDKSYIPNSQDTAPGPPSQTFVDLNANARRMDRKRKCTMCPCCASGPAAKSGEPEKWACMTKQKGKKGRRTKTVRKQGKTSDRINRLTAKTKHSCETCGVPASDCLSTSSMGCNEEIKRLKELLKEKEAALEMLRNTMS